MYHEADEDSGSVRVDTHTSGGGTKESSRFFSTENSHLLNIKENGENKHPSHPPTNTHKPAHMEKRGSLRRQVWDKLSATESKLV